MKTVNTPKGTPLPLVNLKGKDYLQVAHRLIWFNEVEKHFKIETNFLLVNDEQTVAQAIIAVFDEKGVEIKRSQATKRETKKDFSDHTEKAETGAIGRALALMGYGTQFAIADLDEGERLADAPVLNTKAATPYKTAPIPKELTTMPNYPNGTKEATVLASPEIQKPAAAQELAPKKSTFRKPAKTEEVVDAPSAGGNGWE